MCGRFTYRLTWPELVRLYRLTLDAPARNTQPRYNICPTTPIDAVIERGGKRELLPMRWGLIPSWWSKPLKEMKVATFNARAETVERVYPVHGLGGIVEVGRTKHLYQADKFFGLGIKGVAGSRTFGGRAKTRCYLSTSSCAGNRAAVRPPFVFAIFGTVSLSRVLTNSVSFSEKRIGSPLCSAKNCGSNTLNQMPWR
jgi:SOS response associated peptidase (SRAP)